MKWVKGGFIACIIALFVGVFLTACGSVDNNLVSTPEGMCAAVVGNGNQQNGNRTVNNVVYPGDSYRYNNQYDMMRYFPCGPRNYVVSAASGDKGGNVPLTGRTIEGTPVNINITAYWQPNLSTEGIKQFLVLCQKYDCWQDDLGVGSNNSSSDGWQNMLNENMRPTLQRVAQSSLSSVDDSAWSANDPTQWTNLATDMSSKFSKELQAVTGFTSDVFCGSTETGTGSDVGKNYDCQAVRIRVDGVWASDTGRQAQVDQANKDQQARDLKQKQLQADIDQTNTLYGPVLGPQLRYCRDVVGGCENVFAPGGGPVLVGTK